MTPQFKFNISKELLLDLHIKQKLTPSQIADKLGCSYSLILHYFKKYKIKKLPKYQRIEGMRFGKLIVTKFVGISNNNAIWECNCDCGNTITVSTSSLNFGTTQSCGCIVFESNTTHGMTGTRPYQIWQGMKSRCSNSKTINYDNYGGRGITYNPRWEKFELFWEDMQDGYDDILSIERINNNEGYSKENCIWADEQVQSLNKRNNVNIVYKGQKKTITEWSKVLQVNRSHLYYLHSIGLSDEQIITLSLNKKEVKTW